MTMTEAIIMAITEAIILTMTEATIMTMTMLLSASAAGVTRASHASALLS